MMRSIGRFSVFAAAGLGGRSCSCKLKVGEVRSLELGELMVVGVGERMRHEGLLEWRVEAATSAADVRLKVAPRQLIHAQRIVDVSWICANGVSMKDGHFVVEEGIQP